MRFWNLIGVPVLGLLCLLGTLGCVDSDPVVDNEETITEGQESVGEGSEGEVAGPVEVEEVTVGSEGNEESEEEASEEEGGEEETTDLTCEPVGEESPTWYGDIERIFFENCQVCHSDTPLYGAPMSLTSYGDMEGASYSSEGVSMIEMIGARVADGTMPPSSQMPMTAEDREKLEQWVAECGPEGDPSESDLEVPVKAQVPPAPTDAEIMAFSSNNYPVPLDDDHYICFPFTISLDQPMDIVRFDFELGEVEVLHHIVLYGDPEGLGGDVPFECGGMAVDHSQFMYAWAPGGQPLQFPDGFGYPVNDGDKVILQIHYNNMKKLEGLEDSTKVEIYLTESNEEEVGLAAIGPLKIQVSPFSEGYSESACSINETVTMISSFPHMHETGKKFRQVVLREDGTEELIVQVENWDFSEQPYFHTPVVLNPGDTIITRCDFENPNAYTVIQGENTEDEMCFNFAYLYPPLESAYCDEPLDLEEESAVDALPGECAEGIVMAPAVDGTGELGIVENDPAYLTAFPEGNWVLTEVKFLLDPSVLDEYQINVEQSTLEAQASFQVEPMVEDDRQHVVLDMEVGLILIVGGGSAFPANNSLSFKGILEPSEIVGGGMTVFETECEAGQVSLNRLRLQEVEGTLQGYITFDVALANVNESNYWLTFTKVEEED